MKKSPKTQSRVKVPSYTLAEELINSISHGIGAGLAIAALVLIAIKANTAAAAVSGILYASIMILLYLISCIYHALSPRITGKKVLRIIDHCNVLLMVAGTYLPICLVVLPPALGWTIFGIIWAITIPTIVLNCINVDKYTNISTISNLVIGWGALLIIQPLSQVIPPLGLWLLILGGASYTIGAIIYSFLAKIRFTHSIFHFFVLGGSILHFFFIYFFCI